MEESKEVKQIPIVDIVPNRFQPRINFDEKALNDLSNSIKQHGIIQPLVVRPLGDKFEIIAGERRYKAASMAGLNAVPAIVTDMDDGTSAEVALIENVQRKDLSAIEEAKSYKNMLDRGNMTQEELAKKMGLAQSTIANKLRLLNLSEDVQNALMQEKISERHARSLLAIQNKDEQKRWLDRIINERLTVRQLDLAIKDELSENKKDQPKNDIPIVDINPDVESIISNATDINAPKENTDEIKLENLTNIEGDRLDNSNSDDKVEINNIEKQNVPNKFFNFLEDESANMSVEEEKTTTNTPAESEELFSFTPEFSESNENQVLNTDDKKFEEFDALNNNVVNNEINNEDVEVLDVLDIPGESQEKVDEEPIINETLVNDSLNVEPVEEVKNETIQEPVVDDVSNPFGLPEPVKNETEQTNEGLVENNGLEVFENASNNEKVEVEPIPAVEGDNILDPVKLFDTLEPDFYEKIKESAGVDLKTAINKYRDLTTDLLNRGFNISIDEVDADGSYKIEIDIKKE